MSICTSCGKGTLEPRLSNKPILIIKESASSPDYENKQLFSLSGKNKWGKQENTASYYLQREFGSVGLALNSFNLTALYLHQAPKGKGKEAVTRYQNCVNYSMAEVIKVARGKKLIFMMGAEVIKMFTGYNASDVYGLKVKSDLLPDAAVIIPAPNSDKIMNQPIGEMRLALKVFAAEVRALESYMKVSGG